MAAQPVRLAITALTAISGLALVPAPSLAQETASQEAPASDVLPADPTDYRCFVLMRDRRERFAQRTDMTPDERQEILNNLTIIAAFYAGRMTHYPADDTAPGMAEMRQQVLAATPEQRDEMANECAGFYLGVMETVIQFEQAQQ